MDTCTHCSKHWLVGNKAKQERIESNQIDFFREKEIDLFDLSMVPAI